MVFRSRSLVGSSRIRISGLPKMAWASRTRNLQVTAEFFQKLVVILFTNPQSTEQGSGIRLRIPSIHFSKFCPRCEGLNTIRFEKSGFSDGIFCASSHSTGGHDPSLRYPAPRLHQIHSGSAEGPPCVLPGSMVTLPRVGSRSPERIFRKVDLLAPVCTNDAIAVAVDEFEVHPRQRAPVCQIEGIRY